jgi:hypothetical protein
MSERDANSAAKRDAKRERGKFAAWTLFVIGLASTVSQFLAAAWLGVADSFEWRLSTGGLVALAGSWYMWVKCDDWDSWRRKIWIWVGATAVIAFVGMYFANVSSDVAAPAAPAPAVEEAAPAAPAPAVEEVYTEEEYRDMARGLVASEMGQPKEDAFMSAARAEIATGKNRITIRDDLGASYQAGEISLAEYCVKDYWLSAAFAEGQTAEQRANPFAPQPKSNFEILASCTEWLVENL